MAPDANMTRLKQRLDSIEGLSAAGLSRLIGVSPSTMSSAFRGLTRLEDSKLELCAKVTLRLVSLQDALKPCRLPSDIDALAALLEFVEQNGIADEDVRQAISKVFGVANSSDAVQL
jgi:hypothetical protein